MLTPFEIFLVVMCIILFVIFLIWLISKYSSGSNETSGCDFDCYFHDCGDSSDNGSENSD